MRRRRPRGVGRVRPRAAHAGGRRDRPCRARLGGARAAAAPSSRASSPCSPAGATFFTALGDDALGHARVGASPGARTWISMSSGRRAPGPGAPGRTSTARVSGRSRSSARSSCPPGRSRSRAMTSCSSSRGTPRRSARGGRRAFSLRRCASFRPLAAPACRSTSSSGASTDPGEQHDGSLEVAALVLTDGAAGRNGQRCPVRGGHGPPRSSTPTGRATRSQPRSPTGSHAATTSTTLSGSRRAPVPPWSAEPARTRRRSVARLSA